MLIPLLWLSLGFVDSALPRAGEIDRKVVFAELGRHKVTQADRKRFGWKYKLPHLDLEQESFTVIVPKGYDAKQKFGLFVFISPGADGVLAMPRLSLAQLRELLRQHRLLYVGANGAGNDRNPLDRLQLALVAVHNMSQQYAIDPKRVVVGGFSGGGKMAAIAGRFAPEVFTGAVAMGGPTFHRPVAAGPGKAYPPDMTMPPALERMVIQKVSFAFISGPKDFNYEPSIKIEQAYRTAGYRSLLIDVPGLRHEIPGPDTLAEAIGFVLHEEAPAGAAAARSLSSGEGP